MATTTRRAETGYVALGVSAHDRAIYGVGPTTEAAYTDAQRQATGQYRVVPATARLLAAVEDHGGGPGSVRWCVEGEAFGRPIADLADEDGERLPPGGVARSRSTDSGDDDDETHPDPVATLTDRTAGRGDLTFVSRAAYDAAEHCEIESAIEDRLDAAGVPTDDRDLGWSEEPSVLADGRCVAAFWWWRTPREALTRPAPSETGRADEGGRGGSLWTPTN